MVITGGSSGIGFAVAELFAKEGATVYVLDIVENSSYKDNIRFISCDVSNYSNLENAINCIAKTAKTIDCVFAGAGILLSKKIIDSSLSEIDKILSVNLKGIIYILKNVIPIMIKQSYGNIVLMGSDQSFIGKADNSIYGCTKAAVAQLAKAMAVEYGQYNIRTNCVCPGTIDTPFVQQAVKKYSERTGTLVQEVLKDLENAQPIKRLGTADEVANLVLFLCSDLASYMNGSIISIDGGYTAQ